MTPLAAWTHDCQSTNFSDKRKSTHLSPSNDSSFTRFENYALPSLFAIWMRKSNALLIEERSMRPSKAADITKVLLIAEFRYEAQLSHSQTNRQTGTICAPTHLSTLSKDCRSASFSVISTGISSSCGRPSCLHRTNHHQPRATRSPREP